jgi:hypothetical protein
LIWLKKNSSTIAVTAIQALGWKAPTSSNSTETPMPRMMGQRQPQRRPTVRHMRSHSQPPSVAPAAPAIHCAEVTKPASVALNSLTSTR